MVKASKWIDPDRDMNAASPPNMNFSLKEGTSEGLQTLDALVASFDQILRVVRIGNSNKLKFVGLHSDSAGNFWYQPASHFADAIAQSLASMELLVDYAKKYNAPLSLKEKISMYYRRLSDFFNMI